MKLHEIALVSSSAVAVLSALFTISARVPLRGAVALLLHVIALASLYLTLNAELLAAIQLLVYAGAVVTLFIFVLMMVGSSADRKHSLAFAGVGAAALMGVVGTVLSLVLSGLHEARPAVELCQSGSRDCEPFGGVESFGRVLFAEAVVPFELVGMTLLIAVVSAMAIASGKPDKGSGKGIAASGPQPAEGDAS